MNEIGFPLPFSSLRTISGGRPGSYLIGAMYTASYSEKAARFAASCEKFALPYVLHEVPTVHRSISARGSDNLSFTKANFIHHLLTSHRKPILYMDADCEVLSEPVLIGELVKARCDFAIYNWFADEYVDAFIPIELKSDPDGPPIGNRYYRFSHGMDVYTTTQLRCSGLVQLYRNSRAALAMLGRWHGVVATFPGCADDECLDFAVNNLRRSSWLSWFLRTSWLPKSYARYLWWIHTEPVINHPDRPQPVMNFTLIKDPMGRHSFYPSLMTRRTAAPPLPRDAVIDTQLNLICEIRDGQAVPIRPTDQKFWV
jgi:hypothetical protein